MPDALKSFLGAEEPSEAFLVFFHFFDLGLTEHGLVGVADLVGVEPLELF